MRRLLLAFAVSFGLLMVGTTTASASTFCTLDPTIGPLTFGASLGSSGLHLHLYLF